MNKEELQIAIESATSIEEINRLLHACRSQKYNNQRMLAEIEGRDPDEEIVSVYGHLIYINLLKSCSNGITTLRRIQNDKCGVCRKHLSQESSVIDHCHKTALIRGLVHSSCNLKLGAAGDQLHKIKKLTAYLESFSERHARPALRKRKVNSLNFEKANRAHQLAILRQIAFREACELVWAQPEKEYPEETAYYEKAWERLGIPPELRRKAQEGLINIDPCLP